MNHHHFKILIPDINFSYEVGVPAHIVEKVHQGDMDTMRNIAKSLLSKFEKHPDGDGRYYKIMEGSKFFFDINEKDKAMSEIVRDFILHGEYEPHTTDIVKREVKEGDVCVDVGASHGYFTMLFAQRVGMSGKVYSFEPTQNQFKYLRENINANGYQMQVIAENMAAWDKEENNFIGRDVVVNEKALDYMDHPSKIRVNVGSAMDFKGIPLDSILPRKVDFIKIDVDGSEPRVLKGLEETIKNNPQLKMVIEYYPEYIKKMGLNPQDLIDILDKYFVYGKIEGEFSDDYYNFYCVRK